MIININKNNKINTTTTLLNSFNQLDIKKLSKTNLAIMVFLASSGVFADQNETVINQNIVLAAESGVEFELANFGVFAAIVTVFACCICCVYKCHQYYIKNQPVSENNSLESNNVHLSILKETETTHLLFKQPNTSISSEGNTNIVYQIERKP